MGALEYIGESLKDTPSPWLHLVKRCLFIRSYYSYHTTTINGKGEPTLADAIAVATEIGLSKQYATQIIEELTEQCATRKMAKF